MARASVYSLLSLDRYAQILDLNPVQFAGASAGKFFPLRNRCNDLWFQRSWQFAGGVSRENLAQALYNAETEIANELGFYPAPKWIAQEVHPFKRFYRRNLYDRYGRNLRDQRAGVRANYGKVISPGQRAVSLIGAASVTAGTLVYSDADGDGFTERATVTLPTTVGDVGEIKAYIPDHSGNQVWEIRDPAYRALSGGTVEIRFWVWQMIKPSLWEFFPTTATEGSADLAIDITDLDNLLQSVEVYREYTDTTATSATFYWEPTPRGVTQGGFCTDTTDCEACALTAQDGCLHIRDANLGLVVPTPATYDAVSGIWEQDAFTKNRDPDFVKLWYRAGYLGNRYLAGRSEQEFINRWAEPIAWLATARLERPFCGCGNTASLGDNLPGALQEDLGLVGESSHNLSLDLLDNPFGTRRGEIMAWQRVRRSRARISGGGAI